MAKTAFVAELNDSPEFQRLLPGVPDTHGMKAGKVQVAPGASCGQHSTKENEEMLVFLQGEGELAVGEDQVLQVGKGKVAYIPAQTLHDVSNTGSEPLIYIYCVAFAKE